MRAPLSCIVALAAASCAPQAPEAPPVLIENSQVESRLYWTSDLNGKRVSIDGFITFDNGRNGEAIAMGPQLNSQPRGDGRKLIGLDLERGEAPNSVQLPVLKTESIPGMPGAPKIITFDAGKATFTDASGAAHPLGKRVRATGRLDYAGVRNAGLLSDEDRRSPTGRRFKPRLTGVTLETPPAG